MEMNESSDLPMFLPPNFGRCSRPQPPGVWWACWIPPFPGPVRGTARMVRECFGATGLHIPDVCTSWSYELSFPTIIVVFWGFLQQIQDYWMLIVGGNACYLLEISITHTKDDYTLARIIKWQKVSNTAHITSSNVFHFLHSDGFSSCFPLCTIENSLCLFNIAMVAIAHRNRCFLMIYLWKMAIFHGHVAVGQSGTVAWDSWRKDRCRSRGEVPATGSLGDPQLGEIASGYLTVSYGKWP